MSAESSAAGSGERDDRVLVTTRALSLFIVPFLLVAFVLLYGFPGDTQRLFAWTITPTLTPMVLASAYLGGAYFFVRAARARQWTDVHHGFLPVTLFSSLLGVATVIHWDRFNHGHPAFWVWTGLYFTAPFLVILAWLANRRTAPAAHTGQVIGAGAAGMIAAVGGLALVQGLVMFAAPERVIEIWPWALTPLTTRVLGAVFCLGCLGLGVLADRRWQALRLMVQVEMLMVGLILLAFVRAPGELITDRPLTWVLIPGFVILFAGSVWLWVRQEGLRRHG